MSSIIIALPNQKTLALDVPDGDQVIAVQIRECACMCGEWFTPREPHQVYIDSQHRQAGKNRKRRKTARHRSAMRTHGGRE